MKKIFIKKNLAIFIVNLVIISILLICLFPVNYIPTDDLNYSEAIDELHEKGNQKPLKLLIIENDPIWSALLTDYHFAVFSHLKMFRKIK